MRNSQCCPKKSTSDYTLISFKEIRYFIALSLNTMPTLLLISTALLAQCSFVEKKVEIFYWFNSQSENLNFILPHISNMLRSSLPSITFCHFMFQIGSLLVIAIRKFSEFFSKVELQSLLPFLVLSLSINTCVTYWQSVFM